jgi:hypothetical protein
LWVCCGLGGADVLLEVPLREGLVGGALLGAALLAATLPLVPYG